MDESFQSLGIFLRFMTIIYVYSKFEFVPTDASYVPFPEPPPQLDGKPEDPNEESFSSIPYPEDDDSKASKSIVGPKRESLAAREPTSILGQAFTLTAHRTYRLNGADHVVTKTPAHAANEYDSSLQKFMGDVQSFFQHMCNSLGEVKSQKIYTNDTKGSSEEWKFNRQRGKMWFCEWPGGQHPLSTTWPWTIRPSLAVLWGVCWKFFDRPRNAVPVDRFVSTEDFWDYFPRDPPGANTFSEFFQLPHNSNMAGGEQRSIRGQESKRDKVVAGAASSAGLQIDPHYAASEPDQPLPSFAFDQAHHYHHHHQILTAPASPLELTQFDSHSQLPTYPTHPPPPQPQGLATSSFNFHQPPLGLENLFDVSASPAWNLSNNDAETFPSWPQDIGSNPYDNSQFGNFHLPQRQNPGNTSGNQAFNKVTPFICISPPVSHSSISFNHSAPPTAHPFNTRPMSNENPKGGPPTPSSERHGTTPPPRQMGGRIQGATAGDGSPFDSKDSAGNARRNVQPPRNAHGKIICDFEGCEEYIFERKCEWSKHMDKHDRPYRCLEKGCENRRGFTYSGGLLRHQREVHKTCSPKDSLMCPYPYCKRNTGEGFTRKENLNEHVRRVHRPAKESPEDAGATNDDAIINGMQPDLTQPDIQAAYAESDSVTPKRSRKRKQRAQESATQNADLESLEPADLQQEVKRLRMDNEGNAATITQLKRDLELKDIRIKHLDQMIKSLSEHQQRQQKGGNMASAVNVGNV